MISQDTPSRSWSSMRASGTSFESFVRRELIERQAMSSALTDHLIEGLRKAGLEGLSGEQERTGLGR